MKKINKHNRIVFQQGVSLIKNVVCKAKMESQRSDIDT